MQEAPLPDAEAQAEQLADRITDAIRADILRMARALVAAGPSPFGAAEFEVRARALDIGAHAIEQALAEKKNGYDGSGLTCPHCGQSAAYHDDRARTVVSLCGLVCYERAYYYCRRCGRGYYPFDDQAGIGVHHLSPAAERLTALAGAVTDSFEKGSDLVQEMAGLSLSEATTQRVTEDVGADVAARWQRGESFGAAVTWPWRLDARGRSVAYVSIDATGVRQQQGAGAAAEGRMAYVAAVYNPPPLEWLRLPGQATPAVQARYLSGLYELAEVGPLLRRQAACVGMEAAAVWVALTDGGAGLEAFVQKNFNRPDLVVILDFYHAASYLEKLAKVTWPQDEMKAVSLAAEWCGLLKREGGALTLAALREWQWPARKSAAWREQWARVQGYFANNLHRMAYPEYLAAGWHIGSGVVESACKTVVGQRLKGAGKRWGERGAHTLCHVRALYRSEKGQWQAYWSQRRTNRPPVQQLT